MRLIVSLTILYWTFLRLVIVLVYMIAFITAFDISC